MLITTADNLPRLMNCNGSRLMSRIVPIEANQAARDEGNAADWAAERLFTGEGVKDGDRAPNGHIVTSDMIDHVSEYVKALDCGTMQCVTSFGTDRWQINGRADHLKFIGTDSGTLDGVLTVDDLKYGYRLIEPFENWTLIAHAAGYCVANQVLPSTIILRIHQPRAYHPEGPLREWRLSYDELMTYYQRIDASLSNPSDMLQTGDWCYRCFAHPTCPAARMTSMNGVDMSTLAFNDDLPSEMLAYELELLKTAKSRLDGRLDALEELAMHRARKGDIIPGHALETRYANTRFIPGISGEALTLVSGVDCVKSGTITPAEFKRRGGSQAMYETLTERPLIGSKLVRVNTDARMRRLLNKEHK